MVYDQLVLFDFKCYVQVKYVEFNYLFFVWILFLGLGGGGDLYFVIIIYIKCVG